MAVPFLCASRSRSRLSGHVDSASAPFASATIPTGARKRRELRAWRRSSRLLWTGRRAVANCLKSDSLTVREAGTVRVIFV